MELISSVRPYLKLLDKTYIVPGSSSEMRHLPLIRLSKTSADGVDRDGCLPVVNPDGAKIDVLRGPCSLSLRLDIVLASRLDIVHLDLITIRFRQF
jgi:hypothetical protein